jgi:RNA polymerase sigma-70 factor (ECF subfamily)
MEDRSAQDQRLVRSILQGDQKPFGLLVGRYEKLVAGVAWRYGARSEEIEDVVSEVFIKTYRNLHRYRPEHAFSTWLYRLAVNHVLDRARRARKERGRAEMPEQIADGSVDPDRELFSRERGTLLRRALDDLQPRYKEAMFLVYVEGLKLGEAARVLGLPQGTIKTRLMRGRHALRRILVQRHPEYFGERDEMP